MGNKTQNVSKSFTPHCPFQGKVSSPARVGAESRSPGHSGHAGDHRVSPCRARSRPQHMDPIPSRVIIPLLSADHLLADDATEDRNLHSLSSIVESITVEDVSVTFQEERVQN